MPITKTAIFLALAWLIATAPTAGAYIGPGAGLSVIGTALAFVGAVIFAIIGFVWYPLKRLAAALRSSRSSGDEDPKASVS